MVNGLHLYSAFIDPNGHQSALHFASHSPIHTLIQIHDLSGNSEYT